MSVTPEMIAVALGVAAPEPDSQTRAQWLMWIDDAEMLVEARREALNVDGPLDAAKLDYVVREAVASHARRPDDATQVSTSVDDGSVSRTYRSGTGRIAIRDEWWALLGLTSTSGAFAVDMVGSTGLSAHPPFCDLYFGGTTCSCGVALAGYPIYSPGGW